MAKQNDPPISKEMFLEIMDKLKRADDVDTSVYKLGYDNSIDLELNTSFLGSTVIDLLTVLLEKDTFPPDYDGDIYYFCYDLNFGRYWTPGCITETDKDGNETDVDFSSPEKLWDYLVRVYFSEIDDNEP